MKAKIDFSEERDFFASVTIKVADKIKNYMLAKGVKTISCIDQEKDAIYGISYDGRGCPRDILILGFHINEYDTLEIVFTPNEVDINMSEKWGTKSAEEVDDLIEDDGVIYREPFIGGEFMRLPTVESIVHELKNYLE